MFKCVIQAMLIFDDVTSHSDNMYISSLSCLEEDWPVRSDHGVTGYVYRDLGTFPACFVVTKTGIL